VDEAVKIVLENVHPQAREVQDGDRWTVRGELICGKCGELKMALLDSKAIHARFGGPRLFSVACACRLKEEQARYAAAREKAERERREKAMPSAKSTRPSGRNTTRPSAN